MSEYFSGNERLETFEKTGAPMRMGDVAQLMIPDYQVLRNLVSSNKWGEALSYFSIFHAQNVGMNSLLFDWCMAMTNYYAELTSPEAEINLRLKAISNYRKLIDKIKESYQDKNDFDIIDQMKNYFTIDNLLTQTSTSLIAAMEESSDKLKTALKNEDEEESQKFINSYHHQAVIRHDSLVTFTYSYPTTASEASEEKMGIEIANGSMLKNPIWNGLWELTKVLTPVDLAAFLAEHLRFHFSGPGREGQTRIVEDDKKIRLVFDPCGSGGALRRRMGSEIKTLHEKHDLSWNKCGEVNLYCTHCALNEKHAIDLFGYPKFVVEWQADANRPCGWTIYKNKEDVPKEVYERLGSKK